MFGDNRAVKPPVTSTRDPETNSEFTPENGWLEYARFLLGWPIFRGELLVSGSVILMVFFYQERFLEVELVRYYAGFDYTPEVLTASSSLKKKVTKVLQAFLPFCRKIIF